MHRRTSSRTTVAFILAAFIGGAAPSALSQGEGEGHYYMFYKERIPVQLDAARVAVLDRAAQAVALEEAGEAVARGAVAANLGLFGLDAGTIKPHAFRGWAYVDAPAAERADAEFTVRDLVRRIAAQNAADFVSPVFIDEHGPRFITQDIFIGFESDITPEEADAMIAEMGLGEVVSREFSGMPGVYQVRAATRNGFEVLEKANAAALRPEARWAEPDMIFTTIPHLIPNDPRFGNLWGIRNTGQFGGTPNMDMDGDEAWDITIGSNAIITVILDDGIQLNHPDLVNRMAPSADFTGSGTGGDHIASNPCEGHGTAVGGCVAAEINNATGVVGIAPGTRIASAKFTVLNVPCDGTGSGASSVGANAINYSITIGARVTNTSYSLGFSSIIDNAYQNTRNQGVVHFASTGNGGNASIAYPSSSAWVNAVGAIAPSGNRASFSQYGTGIAFVAPGSSIDTTQRGGGYGFTQGTSFSSPYAAGVAALVLSRNNLINAVDVENIMNATCKDRGAVGYDTVYGWGIVNAKDALLATPPPGPPGGFNLLSPPDGQMQTVRFPSFSWSSAQAASSYQFTLADNPGFMNPIIVHNTNLTNYTVTGTPLGHSTTYYWKVQASNSLGTSDSTPFSRSFTTISVPPGPFSLSSPADGAMNLGLFPTLQWTASEHAELYNLQIDDNADFSSPVINTNTTFTITSPNSPLNPGTLYHWRVFAINPLGQTLASPASRSFTTISAPPGNFNLLSPADGPNINTFTPTLDWSDALNADSYTVQVDDDLGFGSPEVNQTGVLVSQFTVPSGALQNNTRYYWRIFAVNTVGQTLSTPSSRSFGVVVQTCCPGNADKIAPGSVSFGDITTVLANFGATYPHGQGQGDADCNGVVNFGDITTVLSNFGNACP